MQHQLSPSVERDLKSLYIRNENYARVLYTSTFLSKGGHKFSARIEQRFSGPITTYETPVSVEQ